jgi:hypothetical protein
MEKHGPDHGDPADRAHIERLVGQFRERHAQRRQKPQLALAGERNPEHLCDAALNYRHRPQSSSASRKNRIGNGLAAACFSEHLFESVISKGLFDTPQLTGEKKPAFGSVDEALAVPLIVPGLCQFPFSNCAALGRCKK